MAIQILGQFSAKYKRLFRIKGLPGVRLFAIKKFTKKFNSQFVNEIHLRSFYDFVQTITKYLMFALILRLAIFAEGKKTWQFFADFDLISSLLGSVIS